MPDLDVILDAQGAWPDLLQRAPLLARWQRLGVLASPDAVHIAIVVELPDGQRAFAHHPWAEVYAALKAIEAQYGPPLERGPAQEDTA